VLRKVRSKQQRAWLRFKSKQPVGFQTRQTKKDADEQAERLRKRAVRADCVARDGYCRYGRDLSNFDSCRGPSEWAHYGDKKRFKTRNQDPEVRHTTKESLMLCRKHHRMYDRGTLLIELLTDAGCIGLLRFALFRARRLFGGSNGDR
jgi:hypothetical protein